MVTAQTQTELETGVIVDIGADENGLTSFAISNANGVIVRFTTTSNTQFGLEDATGSRWVATVSEAPLEAVRRLTNHRANFIPVTVTHTSDNVAISVVDSAPLRVDTNLAWIGAIFAIVWAVFFGYLIWVSGRRKELEQELRILQLSTINKR